MGSLRSPGSMEICPNCGSRHVKKFGKVYLKNRNLQRFRCSVCKYVWHEYIAEKISPKTFDLILEMLRAFIRDYELGKSKNDAGWIPLSEENIKSIQNISFCQIDFENMNVRVNPDTKLPDDILITDEGHLFSDCIKSFKVIEEIWHITTGTEENYHTAVAIGLKSMFKNAYYSLWEKKRGAIPEDIRSIILSPKWVSLTEKFAALLTESLSRTILKTDVGKCDNVAPQKENSFFIFEKLFKNEILKSQWDKIVDYFREQGELIEVLGLLWYASYKATENDIVYEGARIRILDETIKMAASKKRINASDLRERLKNLGDNLDEIIKDDKWGLNWRDVFTTPW